MKKITLLFLLLIAANLKAQDLNIHPSLLSALLANGTVDLNEDGAIALWELQGIYFLDISNSNVTSLQGMEYMENLSELNCSHNPITYIDPAWLTPAPPYYFRLNCSYTNIVSLPVPASMQVLTIDHCPNLKDLNLAGNSHIDDLNLAGLSALETLHVENFTNSLTLHNMSDCVSLKELYTQETYINNGLEVSQSAHFRKINCQNSGLHSFILTSAAELEEINISQNYIQQFNLPPAPMLRMLNCEWNQIITPINLSSSPLLTYVATGYNLNLPALTFPEVNLYLTIIDIDSCNLESLTLGYAPNLNLINLVGNSFEYLDLSGCTIISPYSVPLTGNAYLNLKNGHEDLCYIHYYGDGQVRICADEGEDTAVMQNPAAYSLQETSFSINTYCSETPGGNYNTVDGVMSYNPDGNGCNNSNPVNFARLNLTGPGSSASILTTTGGVYSLFVPQAGTYTVTPVVDTNLFTVTPQSATISFADNNNNTSLQDFCVSPNGSHTDVEIMISPLYIAQPGFDATYFITYKNKGNQILSGDVVLSYDDNVMDFVNSSVAPTTSATGSLLFSYNNLQPFESRVIAVTLNMNGPMETPALNNGDHLNFTASVSPTSVDENPADNTFIFEQTLAGSFDPNDITCLEGDTEHPDNIGKYLHYNINFENTGTAPATFIVVRDMIDTGKFDIASLQLINASHNVKTRINGNKVEFYFDAINLGPNQKGNVLFKIKTMTTLSVNSSVTQNANIYFDYNWPITTNDATTTFQLLSRGDFAKDTSVKIYPNPAASFVNITATTSITSIQVYDVQGRLLEVLSPKMLEAVLDVSGRSRGIYFLKVATASGVKVERIVKE